MKTTLVLLLVAALGIAAIDCAPQKRDVSAAAATSSMPDMAEAIRIFVNAFHRIMPCGDPAMDIPIMEPFRMPIVSLNVSHELLVLNGNITNLVVSGLSNAVIIELATYNNGSTNRTVFDVLYKDVQFLGEYNLYVNADLAGYKFIVNLQGLMNLQVQDLRAYGGITMGTSAVGGITFSDVDYWIEVGDIVSHVLDTQWSVALNDYFNKYVHDTAMIWLKTNRDFMNQLISGYVTETINNQLYNVTMANYMAGMAEISEEWDAITCGLPQL